MRVTATHTPVLCLLLLAAGTSAQEVPDLVLEGEVDDSPPLFDEVTFDIPEGVAEIEIAHDDLSERNILDWGLYDPEAFRGWGGGNSENIVLNADAASRSYLPGPVAAGTWRVIIGKAKLVDVPAPYRIEVTFRDTPTLAPRAARQTYAKAAPLAPDARYYAGDFHVHSDESGDAVADLNAIATFAAAQGLDFVFITDHNTPTTFGLLGSAQAQSDVLLLPGLELTTYAGHLGVYGPEAYVDHRLPLDLQVAAYAAQGAVVAVNHPVLDLGDACIGCAFEGVVPSGVWGVEVQTGASRVFTESAIAFWDELNADATLAADAGPFAEVSAAWGAVGGSDDHRAGVDLGVGQSPIGSPTTQVFAEELSHDAILAGVNAGRTTVQLEGISGPMIELTLTSESEGATASAVVKGGAGTDFFWVIDGRYETGEALASEEATLTLRLDTNDFDTLGRSGPVGRFGARSGGRNIFVRAEVWRGDTPAALTGHQAATEAPDEVAPATCGCESASPQGPRSALAAVLLVMASARGRRRRRL